MKKWWAAAIDNGMNRDVLAFDFIENLMQIVTDPF